jgi:hypothetical protein
MATSKVMDLTACSVSAQLCFLPAPFASRQLILNLFFIPEIFSEGQEAGKTKQTTNRRKGKAVITQNNIVTVRTLVYKPSFNLTSKKGERKLKLKISLVDRYKQD